jgi:heptosyltransferase II
MSSTVRSLVVAPQWIGDAVMAEPLLSTLAGRGEDLTVAALPWVAPVLRAMPAVGTVLEWPFAHGRLDWSARREVARGLRGRFDRAYVLPNSIKAALVPWLARIPERIGYQGEGRIGLLNRRLPNPAGRPAMVGFYAALAGAPEGVASAGAVSRDQPRLTLPPDQEAATLAAFGLARDGYWVFAPGAEYGPAKCWPASHYAEVARELLARAPGVPVLLLGSPKESALADAIAHDAGIGCRPLAGRTTLDQAMALIGGARGMVSNDSGLMHVAAAFGRPQVAVFGSTSPLHTPPLNPRAKVLWLKDELQLDCAPCFERACRFGHTRCLVELAPARVLAALATA